MKLKPEDCVQQALFWQRTQGDCTKELCTRVDYLENETETRIALLAIGWTLRVIEAD